MGKIGKELKDVLTIASGGLSGGISASIAGGNFWAGVRQGLITSGLNHVAHSVDRLIKKSKYVVAGIFGAGGEDYQGNQDIKELVESRGGIMFSSSWPWGNGDNEIIDYLKEGKSKGKLIEIYGYSRGGAAAIRITNELGKQGISVNHLYLFDAHSLLSWGLWRGSYSFELEYGNVRKLSNYYQHNSIFMFDVKNENPFWGNPVKSSFFHHNGMNNNLTSHNYNGSFVNHNNIVKYVVDVLKLK